MESLKRPEVLMSSAAIGVSLGTAFYTYRKVSECQVQVNDLKEHIQATVLRLSDYQPLPATVRQCLEAVQQLNAVIVNQNRDISAMRHSLDALSGRLTSVEESIGSLTEDLIEGGIEVTTDPRGKDNDYCRPRTKPKPSKPKSRGSGKRVTFVEPLRPTPLLTPSTSSLPGDRSALSSTETLLDLSSVISEPLGPQGHRSKPKSNGDRQADRSDRTDRNDRHDRQDRNDRNDRQDRPSRGSSKPQRRIAESDSSSGSESYDSDSEDVDGIIASVQGARGRGR
jgi:uncharacterized coiled-coil protein SlyX